MVILISLPITSYTLTAGIAAGLADRKRPFSLLRLTGARLATLRGVVALEGAVPLLAVSAVAIGVGFAGAAMFATMLRKRPADGRPRCRVLPAHRGRIIVSLGVVRTTYMLARIAAPRSRERMIPGTRPTTMRHRLTASVVCLMAAATSWSAQGRLLAGHRCWVGCGRRVGGGCRVSFPAGWCPAGPGRGAGRPGARRGG